MEFPQNSFRALNGIPNVSTIFTIQHMHIDDTTLFVNSDDDVNEIDRELNTSSAGISLITPI